MKVDISQSLKPLSVEEVHSMLRTERELCQSILERRGMRYGITNIKIDLLNGEFDSGQQIKICFTSNSIRGSTNFEALFCPKNSEYNYWRMPGLTLRREMATNDAIAAITMTDPTRVLR